MLVAAQRRLLAGMTFSSLLPGAPMQLASSHYTVSHSFTIHGIKLAIDRLVVSIQYGLGHHMAVIDMSNPKQQVVYYKSLYATEVFYFASIALSKTSMLCLYLRIFVSRTSRVSCYVLTGIVVFTSLGLIVAVTFQCHPVQYQWDKSIRGGTCFYQVTVYRLLNLPNIAIDLAMLLLPLPVLLKLHTTRGRKIGLICTFLTASV